MIAICSESQRLLLLSPLRTTVWSSAAERRCRGLRKWWKLLCQATTPNFAIYDGEHQKVVFNSGLGATLLLAGVPIRHGTFHPKFKNSPNLNPRCPCLSRRAAWWRNEYRGHPLSSMLPIIQQLMLPRFGAQLNLLQLYAVVALSSPRCDSSVCDANQPRWGCACSISFCNRLQLCHY